MDFDVEVRAVCRCEKEAFTYCRFLGYESSDDDWRPFSDLSEEAIAATSSMKTCSSNRRYCLRLTKLSKSHVPAVVDAQDPASSGAICADCPLAMQFLSTMIVFPIPLPPAVPLFPTSPASPPP